jgi:hypothetical protein
MEKKTIKTYTNAIEADVALSVLTANGIKAEMVKDNVGGTNPGLSFSTGIKLIVDKKDCRRAIELLKGEFEDHKDKDFEIMRLKAKTKTMYMLPIMAFIFSALSIWLLFYAFSTDLPEGTKLLLVFTAVLFLLCGIGPLYSWKIALHSKKKLKKLQKK